MRRTYQARWVSKQRLKELKGSGLARQGILIDSFTGHILVEPKGSRLGDRVLLRPEEADYELQPVWCSDPPAKLAEARTLLGLRTI